ncbi:MAG TPA: hypothetical protein VFX89_00845 [Gammaproteobacteria bacterium]|nr:hypothetical protein [Gammaproteobacteria bacterium]
MSRAETKEGTYRRFRPLAIVLALAIFGALSASAADAQALGFRLDEGGNINSFTRDGDVAAHLLLRSGDEPRILVAFPAGDSGVGLWFAKTAEPVEWRLVAAPRAITVMDGSGRPLHGIEAQVETDAPALRVERAVLSSIRVLRDFELLRTVPDEVLTPPVASGSRLTWARDRLDGAAGYRLTLEAEGDAAVGADGIRRGAAGRLRFTVTALTGEPPLTPIDGAALLDRRAAVDPRSRHVLEFLAYREKYLAGSWRFDTYFGRDTLISLMLLEPALQPGAIGAGIRSVLERLAPNGEVAHEEDIGEQAVLRNAKEGRGLVDTPIYDYGMVDDDFMLAPLIARWLLDGGTSRARADDFLASGLASGAPAAEALARNFEWVVRRSAAFAAEPVAANLVGIKPNRRTGNWRDSDDGLGGGTYPYDVNVALVPAALEAIDRLFASGLLDAYLSNEQRRVLSQAGAQRRIWAASAAPFFRVALSAGAARSAIAAYAAAAGVSATDGLASIGDDGVELDALSLDANGEPVPVLHSDGGFTLLFGEPAPAQVERAAAALLHPFPAGLLTPVGMVVANPVFADPEVQARFSSAAYHGTVVWSWQQALMAAGLERQLARRDLPAGLRARLRDARARLWAAIGAAAALRSSELWSWSFANGCYRPEPFGARRTDVDESNAAQLWSTVFLALDAVSAPARRARVPEPCRDRDRRPPAAARSPP